MARTSSASQRAALSTLCRPELGRCWGEVGVRGKPLETRQSRLDVSRQYFLQHAAALSGSGAGTTRCRHVRRLGKLGHVHTAPGPFDGDRAMSHAAVKTPKGLDVADGSYISWGHHGPYLLEVPDVRFLAEEIGAAARDAAAMTDVYGPTIVYARNQLASEILALPKISVRDRIDEAAGTVAKWPVPILSITRLEWLPGSRLSFLFGRLTVVRRDAN